jgi:hypothetical protein
MSKLPLVDKNAYLSIYISRGYIYSVLAYAHYDIGRKYTQTDQSKYKVDKRELTNKVFWIEFFDGLESKFSWDLLSKDKSRSNIAHILNFDNEGVGVSNIRVTIDSGVDLRSESIAALREYIPGLDINIDEPKTLSKLTHSFSKKLNYVDTILLNLDLDKFEITRIIDSSSANFKARKNEKAEFQNTHCKIKWDNKEALIDSVRDSRIRAFMSTDIDGTGLYNDWANFVLHSIPMTQNNGLKDLIRSFISVQLLSLFNNNKSLFDKFGINGEKSLLIVEGDIISLLGVKALSLSLFDGLQLRGTFDMYIDYNRRFRTLGHNYSAGINSADYIVTQEQVLRNFVRCYLPEVPGKGTERKVVFSGNITGSEVGEKGIYGLTPTLVVEKLPNEKGKYVFDGKFVKGSYVEGLSESIEFTSETDEHIDYVLIDGRFKPVVYGPDYRSNSNKINSWLND